MASETDDPTLKHEHASDFERERAITELVEKLRTLREAVKENPTGLAAETARELVETYLLKEESPVLPEPLLESVSESEPEKEASPEIMTFEAARKQPHDISNEAVGAILDGNPKVGGKRVFSLKNFLDFVPADESDKEFAGSVEQKSDFHNDLADLMQSELRIFASPVYDEYLKGRRVAFGDRLERGKVVVKQHLEAKEWGAGFPPGGELVDAVEFHGFQIPTSDGKNVDLLEYGQHVDGIYPNLAVQRTHGAPFIQWSSEKYIQEKMTKERSELASRVYLNPSPQKTIEIFKELIHALDGAGLTVKAKLLDRSGEGTNLSVVKASSDIAHTRADSIMVAATKKDEAAVLELVHRIYEHHETEFKDRPTPKIPYEIASGMALGSNPAGVADSLTSHRTKILERVWDEAEKSGEKDRGEKVKLFKKLERSEMIRNGVNPDNIAFNLS